MPDETSSRISRVTITGGGSTPLSDTGPQNRPNDKWPKPVSTETGDDHLRADGTGVRLERRPFVVNREEDSQDGPALTLCSRGRRRGQRKWASRYRWT